MRDTRPVRRVVRDANAPPVEERWLLEIPAVAQVLSEGLDLPAGVTMLVGENGTGKSTIVEAIAMAFGLSPEGGTPFGRHSTRRTEAALDRMVTLQRSPGAAHWGFFLRAETMHGYYTFVERSGPSPSEPSFHEMSHGESFLEILRTRFDSPGLYCLDEPEAALSFASSLALVGVLSELAQHGAQVLCATHSPIVASTPDARLLELGPWGMREVPRWEDLELVQHWRGYLEQPDRYLRHLVE